ncbi:MAG TPA: ABC transporter substrate-binding protein, partial [Thermoanaerobaculia bacterium]|nr:ABC transporter substrate-binding protein [Thermoanaerobaculia bacterium]
DGDATAPAAAEPVRGGQVVVGITSDVGGVNPLIVPPSTITTEISRRLFLPLVGERPDYSVAPRLAESWEFSDDRLALTLHLRDDVVWSDGTPVTSADVVFTYQAWTDPDVAWEGASSLEAVAGVDALDAHTVRFRFHHVYSAQLLDVASGGVILPAHAWSRLPFAEWRGNADWFRQNLVVDGPFTLASWRPQQELVLERNPRYYEPGLPRLDRVVFRVIPDQSSQLTQLLGGDVDFAIQLGPEQAATVEEHPDTRVISYWSRGYIGIGWNVRREPFAESDVRRALTLGIDRQTLVDSIWGPHARVVSSLVLPDTPGHDPDDQPLPYDPDQARRLLEQHGWVDRDGDGIREKAGQRLVLRLITNAGNRQREDALVLIQEQLRRVGVAVESEVPEFNAFLEQVYGGDFDGVLGGWVVPTTFDFRYALHSSEIGGNNVIGFADPRVDRLLEQVRSQPTLEAARPLLVELQAVLRREQPYTFLWQSQRLHGVSERLHGLEPSHLFTFDDLRHWWVEPEAGRAAPAGG